MAWIELKKAWHDTSVDYCEVCGSLLIGRYWSFRSPDGQELRACREDDEALLAWLGDQYARERVQGRESS